MGGEGVVTMVVVATFCQSVAKQRVYCLNVGANSGGHQCLCIYPACYEYVSSSSSSSSFSWCSLTALPPFFLFLYLLLHVHTLYSLITHLLTHTVATSCVFVLAHPPALGSAYSGVLALDSFAPTCRARVRKEAGSYSYDYPSYSSDA